MKQNNHTDRTDITELIYAIQNIIHTEYHLIETLMLNQDIAPNELFGIVNDIRGIRKSLMLKLTETKPQLNGLWCFFKHLFATQTHLFELYERNLDKYYLDQALKIHLIIDEVLAMDNLENLKDCPRCDEDKGD